MINKNKVIYDDLFRYTGKRSLKLLIRYVLFTPSFRYIYFFRMCQKKNFLFPFYRIMIFRYSHKYGIQIPYQTKIGRGFRILHFGSIVINPSAVIGKNFNISQNCTVGMFNEKSPVIEDNVSMQPNAVVTGGLVIGKNSLIGPNTFVNFDVPENSLVIGVRASIHKKNDPSMVASVFRI